jgi:uncharacterized protein (TIGR00251 family)
MPAWYQWQDRDPVLALHVQPGASHDRLDGCHDDRLKVRISAPPAHGRANTRLPGFLASLFDVPRRHVELLSGAGKRRKRLRILAPRASSHTPDLRRGPMVDVMRMSTVIYRQVSGYNQQLRSYNWRTI